MSNWTLPNLLSLLRMASAPFVVIAMTESRFDWALALYIGAGCTDFIDGYLARRFGWTSKLGAFLDPAGDKLLLVAVYVALAFRSLPGTFHFPPWLTILVLSRDVIIVVGSVVFFVAQGQKNFPPSPLGRLTTGVLLVDGGAAILANIIPVGRIVEQTIIWSAAILAFCSGFDYVFRAARRSASEPTNGS